MLMLSVLPAHATSLLVNLSLYSFLRPPAELPHVSNIRLLKPDDPSFVPSHGSYLDSHLVNEGEVDSHILKRSFIFDILLVCYIWF